MTTALTVSPTLATSPDLSGRTRRFLFMRHGETALNRDKLRCGGDIDIPLTETGEAQALAAAERLAGHAGRIDALFVSPLIRTRRTAEIVHAALGTPSDACPVILHDGLIERRLGAWNGMGIAETQPWFDAALPPPGGETEETFRARIVAALADILGRGHRLPLLVGSKGVARIVGLLFGAGAGQPLGNAAVLEVAVSDSSIKSMEALTICN